MSTRINVPVAEFAKAPGRLPTVAAIQPDPLRLPNIAEAVCLVGGVGNYGLFVDQGKEIVAIGTTAGVAERTAELRNR